LNLECQHYIDSIIEFQLDIASKTTIAYMSDRLGRTKTPLAFTPIAGLMVAATSWGVIWYPYRAMEQAGLPAPIATFCAYIVAVLFASALFGRAWREFAKYPISLMIISLAAGITNVAYLVAIMEAEVVRVVLLFYLAPLWTIPMARVLLNEKISVVGAMAIGIAMTGAVVMLWRPELGAPMPKNPHEWLGMLGGFTFALSNVLVRREVRATPEAKSLAGAIGVAMVAIPAALLLVKSPIAVWPSLVEPHIWLIAITGIVLMSSSVAMQYGLTKLAANRAAVILLFELIVAAIAAHYLADETTRFQEWIGGLMIIAAGLLVTFWTPKISSSTN
jgi:drug/metabolite transporter (DMT)-like permease